MIARVFLKNKFMVMAFIIGLAVSMLFTSTLTLTQMFFEDSVELALRGVKRHMVIGFVVSRDESPLKTIDNAEELIRSFSEVESLDYTIYFGLFSLTKNLDIDLLRYNTSITVPSGTLLVILAVKNPPVELKPVLYLEYNEFPGHGEPGVVLPSRDVEAVFFGKNITVSDISRLNNHPLTGLWQEYVAAPLYSVIMFLKEDRSVAVLVLSTEDLGVFYNSLSSYIGPCRELERVASVNLILDFSREFHNLLLDADELSDLMSMYSDAVEKGYALVFTGVSYDLGRVVYGYSISASIRKISEVIHDLGRKAREEDYAVFVSKPEIVYRLRRTSLQETLIRFSTIIGLIPSFIVVWIASSRIPPVMVSVLRKVIALMRIRGVSTGSIKESFTLAIVVWAIAGILIGLVLGPVYAVFLKKAPILRSLDYIRLVSSDIYVAIGLTIVVLVALSLSLRKSFSILSRVSPREFTRPTVLVEYPVVEKGLGVGGWIMFLLGIYYAVKTATGFSPVLYMTGSPPESPVLTILLIILLVLEPVVSFFGPIFFVYGTAKFLVAYPDKLVKLVNILVTPLVGELKSLVSRLIEVKPARIAVSILITGFSIAILFGGIVGEYTINTTFDNIRDVGYGTDYYLYKYVSLQDLVERRHEIVGNVTSYVRSDHVVMYIVAMRNDRMYVDDHSVDYIVFIDKDMYTRVFRIPDPLGVEASARELILKLGEDRALYVLGSRGEGISTGRYKLVVKKHVEGASIDVLEISIVGNMHNFPGSMVIEHIGGLPTVGTQIEIVPGAAIPIPHIRPCLIMDASSLDMFLNKLLESVDSVGGSDSYGGDIVFTVVVASNSIDEDGARGSGWRIYRAVDEKKGVDYAREIFLINSRQGISSGLVLYTISLIAVALIAYSSIYENLYAFTLLRARGVGSSRVMRIAVAESFTVSMLGLIPGVILGAILGYNSTRSFFYVASVLQIPEMVRIYGLSQAVELVPEIIVPATAIPLVVVVLSLLVSYLTYRRVLREALVVLGSHM